MAVDRPRGSNRVWEADRNANRNRTSLLRASAGRAPGAGWTVTPAVYYQESQINDAGIFWPILSRPPDAYASANPGSVALPRSVRAAFP